MSIALSDACIALVVCSFRGVSRPVAVGIETDGEAVDVHLYH